MKLAIGQILSFVRLLMSSQGVANHTKSDFVARSDESPEHIQTCFRGPNFKPALISFHLYVCVLDGELHWTLIIAMFALAVSIWYRSL